jgi:hypothetical protein
LSNIIPSHTSTDHSNITKSIILTSFITFTVQCLPHASRRHLGCEFFPFVSCRFVLSALALISEQEVAHVLCHHRTV